MRSRRLLAFVLVVGLMVAPAATAAAGDNPDDRARVSFVTGTLDEHGELWLKVVFYVPWDGKPPSDLFSFFFELAITVGDETSVTGWEIHDGDPLFLGDSAGEAYILDNGCVVVSTGIFPQGDFGVDVTASFGSWLQGAENPIFGGESMSTSAEFVESGDPFTVFGGQPVYDLASQEMIMATTTTTAAPATTSAAETTTTTEAAPTTTTASPATTIPVSGGDTPAIVIGDSNFLLMLLLLLLVLIGVIGFGWWFGWWGLPFGLSTYGDRVKRNLGGDPKPTDTDPHKGTEEPPSTGTQTGTRGSTSGSTTGTSDADDGDGEPEVFDDREEPKKDCTPLRLECERLKEAAARAKIDSDRAAQAHADAEAECARATQRISDLEARVSDLEQRDDAVQRYQRLTEAQQALRDAQSGLDEVCGKVGPLGTAAEQAASAVAEAQRLADDACRKAEECEAQQ